jgi:hypothetical protein
LCLANFSNYIYEVPPLRRLQSKRLLLERRTESLGTSDNIKSAVRRHGLSSPFIFDYLQASCHTSLKGSYATFVNLSSR